ncbi:MAG: hypothetical protein WD847_16085 [Pirellulales bacterium]
MNRVQPAEQAVSELMKFECEALARSTKATVGLIHALDAASRARSHSRRTRPLPLAFTAPAVALDEQFKPLGEQFTVTVRDVCTTGLALLDTQPIGSKYVAVQLGLGDQAPSQAVVQIRRCDKVGPYYEMAGTFIQQVGHP